MSKTSQMCNGKTVFKDINFYYYITDGEKTYTNVQNTNKTFFEQYDTAFYAFENNDWSFGRNTRMIPLKNYHYFDMKFTIYIAFPDQFMKEKQQEWQESKAKLILAVIYMATLAVLALMLIILLIYGTGRKPQDKELHLSKLDNIYSDVLCTFIILISILWIFNVSNLPFIGYQQSYQPFKLDFNQIFAMIWVTVTTAAAAAISGVLFLSLVRKIKSGKMLKHSLLFTVGYKIYDFFKSLFDGRIFAKYPLTKSLFYRQLVFIITSVVLVFLTLLFVLGSPPGGLQWPVLLPFVLETLIIYWYIKGNNKTFADINKGFNDSLEEQMKSERMKVALITNVSHDLKTPLTSIISYIDLLSKEENLSESAGDYVKILMEKSNRLKHIVSDLFDLAKSTSGNMPVDSERIDMKKLIEQTLADMGDEIEKSGLQMKVKLPDKPISIISDGKKLYRVFQNVIGNALKYSLKGTRVFVELEEIDGKAVARIKNTAGYEMDFTVDEILQRFNRGDKSRTTEGSGLGLSIAESFTNVCGGDFKIDIDGDLFKATLSFNLC